jgi:hypothetical protein
MNEEVTIEEIQAEGYFDVVQIPERGYCGLIFMMFTVGLAWNIDKVGYSGRYCYPNLLEARVALKEWDGKGDPSGNWIKYKGRGGERSNPNFDEFD